MATKEPILVYVEDDENSILVMKMIVERVMKLPKLYVLESRADIVQQVDELGVRPDVILMDIQMKPYDGFALLSMLKGDSRLRQCKVVALTASVTNEEVSLLQKSGFDGAIAKPLDIEVFPSLIDRTLNGEPVWHIM
jgi:CheY-like chemotaxis protein